MSFLNQYQLFLFDFDGLLVDTEPFHFEAYKAVCAEYGAQLEWSLETYCLKAHYGQKTFCQALIDEHPVLRPILDSWDSFYAKKKKRVIQMFETTPVSLMPGVHALLEQLKEGKAKRCVVTHSSRELVSLICQQHPILNTIPHWFSRENYQHPKPHPGCYQKAIEALFSTKDQLIGFEDSPRGLSALKQALSPYRGQVVFVTELPYCQMHDLLSEEVEHHPSLQVWMQRQTQRQ